MANPMEVILPMKVKSNRLYPQLCALVYALVYALGLAMAGSTGVRAAEDGASEIQPPELTSEEDSRATDDSGRDSRRIKSPVVRERVEYGQTITEYERRGGVYLMTVKPRVGPTQYWSDRDGDGQFQRSTNDGIDEDLNLPKWRLGSW